MKQPPEEYLESRLLRYGKSTAGGILLTNVTLSINPNKAYYDYYEEDLDGKAIKFWENAFECARASLATKTVSVVQALWNQYIFTKEGGVLNMTVQVPEMKLKFFSSEAGRAKKVMLHFAEVLGVEAGPITFHFAALWSEWEDSGLPHRAPDHN